MGPPGTGHRISLRSLPGPTPSGLRSPATRTPPPRDAVSLVSLHEIQSTYRYGIHPASPRAEMLPLTTQHIRLRGTRRRYRDVPNRLHT